MRGNYREQQSIQFIDRFYPLPLTAALPHLGSHVKSRGLGRTRYYFTQTKMNHWRIIMLTLAVITLAQAYNQHAKDVLIRDALLREVVERMGKDLADAAASGPYLDFPLVPDRLDPEAELSGRAFKELDAEEQTLGDYGLQDGPQPSLRDQEFLQHSSLWGHQFVTGGAGEGKQLLKPKGSIENQQEIKTDAVLPAYCNPPNPCPVGYTDGCLAEFKNTASFSRDFQAAQDCMCDTEHMFDCSKAEREANEPRSLSRERHRIDSLVRNFEQGNPFLRGDKLPVAAKKGFDVDM